MSKGEDFDLDLLCNSISFILNLNYHSLSFSSLSFFFYFKPFFSF